MPTRTLSRWSFHNQSLKLFWEFVPRHEEVRPIEGETAASALPSRLTVVLAAPIYQRLAAKTGASLGSSTLVGERSILLGTRIC